ncbi:hypothetical protein [Rariglobus hedericola]|uniref:Tetratricopeptide repeat protein n=1 Tax=Rariglobus hedericola TaxID=2597822 RepID=A0A556QKT1_9BACT|nr:hypothetical protein [Rariglobus hedericola]TSJ77212.1 hypothetical protein FPL22_14025 [Rariglobus hedericola]
MLLQLKRRKSRKKRVASKILILGVLIAVGFALPPVYREAKQRYKAYKSVTALRQAKVFFAAGEPAKAVVALQVAIRNDRQDPEVWKTIAEMSEALGRRESIQQRQQVVSLRPGDHEALIALALTAMKFGDVFTARDALSAVPVSFRDTTGYRRAVALFAIIEGNGSTADQVLASLMRTDSSDNVRLMHATVRMSHPDPVVAQSARQELAGMVETPALAAAALRELMQDSIRRNDLGVARAWSERLVSLPNAQFNDHLVLQTLLMATEKKPLDKVLPPLVEKSTGNAASTADLVRWLLSQGQFERARSLVDAQPADVKDNFAMKAVRVDLAAALQDWPGMGELIYQGALGPVPEGAMRLALESRTVGELHGEEARFTHWKKALDQTRNNIFGLRVLYQVGVTWKWAREVEETLLTIAGGFPGQTWAHEALVRVYSVQKNGPGLQRIFGLWSQQSPGVNRLKHDAALMDLLVLGSTVAPKVKLSIEGLSQSEPSNPNYTTTCALVYALTDKSQDALVLIAKLKPAERRDQARAHYLAFIYAKGGQSAAAREQLALVRPEALLNEEMALVTQAKVIVAQLDLKAQEIERLTRGKPKPPGAAPVTKEATP